MFIYTFKANKKALLGASLVLLALVILFFLIPSHSKQTGTRALELKSGKTNAERIAFIENFGYDVVNEPVETKFVVLPEEFDDTYLSYNELQKQQGFDLDSYKGKRVISYAYAVTDYPGVEDSEKTIRANLLVADGRIIAADVCSVALDGFMHALCDGKTG